ncbi:hypothetical protein F5Y14DRAFT_444763 [Nemania sp. NC0429]|nr:hypothetical protein F5Y14DRAFT_444763 [Nemania sp. NC0429]
MPPPPSSDAAAFAPRPDKSPPPARPSASIIVVSPTNQVLLLHRVQTSTAFASAHVFPGGNLSAFHDGPVPDDVHADALPYRLGAIRETFEESGILLARRRGGEEGGEGSLLKLPVAERDAARKAIYENEISFGAWLERVGGVADTENLLPFTRWVTPPGPPKRFTTQMYVYMLPVEEEEVDADVDAGREALIPTPDGGAEITTARFDDVDAWLERQRRGDIVLFPPQCFLLHLLAPFLRGPPASSSSSSSAMTRQYYRAQREGLRRFMDAVPTSTHKHPTSMIPWAEKVISPVVLGLRAADGRTILGLDKPGGELRGSGRGGDWERVVLVRFGKGGPRDAEVRGREEVFTEEREAKAKAKAREKEEEEVAAPKL